MELESGTEEITEGELLAMMAEEIKRNTMVAMPAKVEAYTVGSQTVDVTPQFNRSLPDGQGAYVSESLPKVKGIQVCFQRCGKFMMTFPIAVGDYGLLIICDRNLSQWRATGAQGDPGDLGLHTLDGAVFIPGLFPDSSPAQNANGANMVLGSDTDGNSRIEIKPTGGMNLGAGASKGVARNGDTTAADTTMTAWITAVSAKFNAPAAPMASAPGTLTPPTDFGKINTSSLNIKAVD